MGCEPQEAKDAVEGIQHQISARCDEAFVDAGDGRPMTGEQCGITPMPRLAGTSYREAIFVARQAMPVAWDEHSMATGIPSIDEQHRELVARYNRFHRALLASAGRDHLVGALEYFLEYTTIHFPPEEALMAHHNCPAAEPNRLAHRELVATLNRVAEKIRGGGVSVTAALELESTLANWLRTHLCTVDFRLRETPASQFHRRKSA